MQSVDFQRPDGKTLQIEIIRYERGDKARDKFEGRHRHLFHSIFFIQEGYSQQEIDFENYLLQANQVMLIPQGAIHWETKMQDFVGYVILFKADFFSDVQKRLLNGFMQYAIARRKLLINVVPQEMQQLAYYFQLLFQEQQAEENQNLTFLLQNLMLALLNKLESLIQYLPESNSFINQRIYFQKFIGLLESYYVQQKSLDFYSTHLQITTRKLNDIIKNMTGQTATNFLIDRVILEAKRQLCFSEKSIKEIAHELGYSNQYYFSRLFSKRTEQSPQQFRAKFAE